MGNNQSVSSQATSTTGKADSNLFSEYLHSGCNEIEHEAELINSLLSSAKSGNFKRVFQIIGEPEQPKNDHLLNCIPDNRRWGVLHQAVYFRNPETLKKLLRFEACDSDMRAKKCSSECGDTSGMHALEIARAYGYEEMGEILTEHDNTILEQELLTYQNGNYLGLISNTLAAYKSTFHPKYVSPMKSVFEVLKDVFLDISINTARFKVVKEQVCDAMHIVSSANSSLIKEAGSREEFFKKIEKVYTIEQNYLYTYISTALRRQRNKNYKPTGDDLALGPYAVMYQMLLLFWDKLSSESQKTYRQMKMKKKDIEKYSVGTKFIWPAVVSSTTELGNAQSFPTCETVSGDETIMFEIDNSTKCIWQPKNIEKYARFEENERTYPAGTKFLVRSVEKTDVTRVHLKLLDQ